MLLFPFKAKNVIGELTKEAVAQAANIGFWSAAIPSAITILTLIAILVSAVKDNDINMEDKRNLEKRIQELEQQLKDQGT